MIFFVYIKNYGLYKYKKSLIGLWRDFLKPLLFVTIFVSYRNQKNPDLERKHNASKNSSSCALEGLC